MNNLANKSTQDATQATVEAQSTGRINIAELMKIATISDNTRSYLILIGKLADLECETTDIVERDYLTSTDEMLDVYRTKLCEARSELETLLIYSICEQMGFANSSQI